MFTLQAVDYHFFLQIQSTQSSIRYLIHLWIYCTTHRAPCRLAVRGASRRLGEFILNSCVMLHKHGCIAHRADWGIERRFTGATGTGGRGAPVLPQPTCWARDCVPPASSPGDSSWAAESFPYLTTLGTLCMDKLQDSLYSYTAETVSIRRRNQLELGCC